MPSHAIQSSLAQAISGTRPLTAFVIEGPVARRRSPDAEERAAEWLVDAWRQYAAACR